MNNPLQLEDTTLAILVENATFVQLRDIMRAACKFAVESNHLDSPLTNLIMLRLDRQEPVDSNLEARLIKFVEDLDVIQWDLYGKLDRGIGDKHTCEIAFQKARAANSILAALDPDPFSAATNSSYEAFHATEQKQKLKEILLDILGERGNKEK